MSLSGAGPLARLGGAADPESCGNRVVDDMSTPFSAATRPLSRAARRGLVVGMVPSAGSAANNGTCSMLIWDVMKACSRTVTFFHSARSTSNTNQDGLSPSRGAAPTIRPASFAFLGMTRPFETSTASRVRNSTASPRWTLSARTVVVNSAGIETPLTGRRFVQAAELAQKT